MDSGADGICFISEKTAATLEDQFQIGALPLAKPVKTYDYKDRKGSVICDYFVLPVNVEGHEVDSCVMYVVKGLSNEMIVGRGFLQTHGGIIDHAAGQLGWKDSHCSHSIEKMSRPKVPSPTVKETIDPDLDRKGKPMDAVRNLRRINEQVDSLSNSTNQSTTRCEQPTNLRNKIDIFAIGASAFMHHVKLKAEIFAVTVKDVDQELAKRNRQKEAMKNLPKLVPECFHEHLSVFDYEESKRLPPHREQFDHRIKLLKDARLPKTERLRRTSTEELQAIRDWLRENLSKGWLEASSADYASPILLVKKPGGGIRVCIDYRGLNHITERDRYPLPLIADIMGRVRGARIFTKLDIIAAFHQLRMATPKDEDLTSFQTALGMFKFKVMPFGLCNAPSSWQRYINSLFNDMTDFVAAYVDDLIIFSKNKKDHVKQVNRVLQRLREAGLTVDILKTEFFTTEVKFLGFIVTTEGLCMDPKKVEIIKNWEKPSGGRDLKGIRRFLGFTGFYRKLMDRYGHTAKPLFALLQTNSPGIWTEEHDKAFQGLKDLAISERVILHHDSNKQSLLEADASDGVVACILSQFDDKGNLRPCAFYSCAMTDSQRNYPIHDKELLAIVLAFEEWRPELMSAPPGLPVKVLTDHQALKYFMTTKQLNSRQARWAEKLSEYNFEIQYRPGKQNQKADFLTREANIDFPRAKEDPHMRQTLLPSHNLSPDVQEWLSKDDPEELDLNVILLSILNGEENSSLFERVKAINFQDPVLAKVRQALLEVNSQATSVHGFRLENCEDRDGYLYFRHRLAIPEELIKDVIQEVHCSREVGHHGIRATLKVIRKSYDRPGLSGITAQYIKNCFECCANKADNQKPQGLLKPLPIPEKPWTDIAMDFISLPPSKEGNDTVLVTIDRLSKERHFSPMKKGDGEISSEATARRLVKDVWRLHGLPDTIVSDRGSQFVSRVWKHLNRILGIKSKLSTAYHPETDGQTENANKQLIVYLRHFADYHQENWEELLPMAEFSINAKESESTGVSPFMATRGVEPRMSFDAEALEDRGVTARDRIDNRTARSIAQDMQAVWDYTKQRMAHAQRYQKASADKYRREADDIQVEDYVWLDMSDLRTERPSRKLDHKRQGPYKVLAKITEVDFKLELPVSMDIHPIFHVKRLRKAANDPIPGQELPRPEPVILENEEEWEVEDILDVKVGRGRGGRSLLAKATWVGYPPDNTWYPINDFKNSRDILQEFYLAHPNKPRPDWLDTGQDPLT